LEKTGLIENSKNIWMHPPRMALFKILELNPFPYVKFPCEIGEEWIWKLTIGDMWGDERWKTWNGQIENNYFYKIVEKEKITTQFYENIDCWIIDATAKSELGETFLRSYFNEQIGFVKWEYINIDNSKIIFEIKKANDTDN